MSWNKNPLTQEKFPECHLAPVCSIPNVSNNKKHLANMSKHVNKYNKWMDANFYVLNDKVLPGGYVNGTVEVTCHTKSKLKLGRMDVFLVGFEELASSKNKNNKNSFLSMVYPLQNPSLAPSDLVVPGPPDEHGCWRAKKTFNKFDFSFKLPLYGENGKTPLPPSFSHPSVGKISYFVVYSVQIKLKNKIIEKPLQFIREIQVFEAAAGSHSTLFTDSAFTTADLTETIVKQVSRLKWFKKEQGQATIDVTLKPSDVIQEQLLYKKHLEENDTLSTGVFVAGSTGFLSIKLQNDTFKPIDKLEINLIERYKTFEKVAQIPQDGEDQGEGNEKETFFFHPLKFYRSKIQSKYYNSNVKTNGTLVNWDEPESVKSSKIDYWWPGAQVGKSIEFIASIAIPSNIWTVKNAELIEITFALQVITKSKGSELTVTEIPVHIVHPLSTMINLPVQRCQADFTRASQITLDRLTRHASIVLNTTTSTTSNINKDSSFLSDAAEQQKAKEEEEFLMNGSVSRQATEMSINQANISGIQRTPAARYLLNLESSPSIVSERVVEEVSSDFNKRSQLSVNHQNTPEFDLMSRQSASMFSRSAVPVPPPVPPIPSFIPFSNSSTKDKLSSSHQNKQQKRPSTNVFARDATWHQQDDISHVIVEPNLKKYSTVQTSKTSIPIPPPPPQPQEKPNPTKTSTVRRPNSVAKQNSNATIVTPTTFEPSPVNEKEIKTKYLKEESLKVENAKGSSVNVKFDKTLNSTIEQEIDHLFSQIQAL